jgi:periplasmic protein CpxP/Spy
MKNMLRSVIAPTALALAILSGSAYAQTAAPASAMSSSSTGMSSHAQKRADVVEQRIAELHSQLMITDQQSKQWDAFAQTMRDNAKKTGHSFHDRSQKLATMNADEAMKSYAALAQQHADNMQKLSSAMSDLYAVLSPEQKETADTLYRNQTPKHHHGKHGHGKSGMPASASSSATSG